jgi:hypothetical protein
VALVLKDRVKETTTTIGEGPITLAGPVDGFQAFSTIGDGNTTYYTITGGSSWEVGIGTYTLSTNSLSRDVILDSSQGGAAVSLLSGVKDVFITYPAGKAMSVDGVNGPVVVSVNSDAGTSALTVTQTGLGNALLVEDSTSPDASPTLIDLVGNLVLGKTSRQGTLANSIEVHTASTKNSSQPAAGFYSWSTNTNTAQYLTFFKYPSNTIGTLAGNGTNEKLGFLTFLAYDGSSYTQGHVAGVAGPGGVGVALEYSSIVNNFTSTVKIGGTADRATTEGTNQLVLFNGTAPVGTLANGVAFYSSSGEANVMDAAGNATLLSPHDAETNEWIFRSKHTPTGKVLKINVERLLRFVNDHFGLDEVKEFVEE